MINEGLLFHIDRERQALNRGYFSHTLAHAPLDISFSWVRRSPSLVITFFPHSQKCHRKLHLHLDGSKVVHNNSLLSLPHIGKCELLLSNTMLSLRSNPTLLPYLDNRLAILRKGTLLLRRHLTGIDKQVSVDRDH